MTIFIAGLVLMGLSGVPGLLLARDNPLGERLAGVLAVAGALFGLAGTVQAALLSPGVRLLLPWPIPGGAFALHIDPLAAIFLLPLFLVFTAGSLFGHGYWPQREHPDSSRQLRLFYGLIGAAIALVVTADNGILFLFSWEVMALAGFFLVTCEQHKGEVRRAGLLYLAATHTSTLALFALFALLTQTTGSFALPATGSLPPGGTATALFLLGLFGFGLKAGLMPLHIWLPAAHAAAPSQVSALLSGVMIKTGIYGLVRLCSLFAEVPPWWGGTILLLGAVSGLLGVAWALAQHDIKRLLAYHSVENIGIIALGLGLSLFGRSAGMPLLTLLGLAGALLHVINHALFKSLLFLAAGSVIHATGSREIDRGGGLLRLMPWTGAFFLGGAVAICGLPPLNGFVSEWLIYLGAFQALAAPLLSLRLTALAAAMLALIGALAVACFVKVFGVVFLGSPRSAETAGAHEATRGMRLAMGLLLAGCIWIGLLPWTLVPLLHRATATCGPVAGASLTTALTPLPAISFCGWLLVLTLAAGGVSLWRRERGRCRRAPTWGCGYPAPTPRMQYSGSSLADAILDLFPFGLGRKRHGGPPEGLFPAPRTFHSFTPDAVLDRLLWPALRAAGHGCLWLRIRLQHGVVGGYLLYVALTLGVLLFLSSFPEATP